MKTREPTQATLAATSPKSMIVQYLHQSKDNKKNNKSQSYSTRKLKTHLNISSSKESRK